MKGIAPAQSAPSVPCVVSKAQETEGLQYLHLRFEPALRIQGSTATGTRSGNCLTIGMVNGITAGENTREIGCGPRIVDHNVARLVQRHLIGDQRGAGKVANRNKNTFGF